MIKNAYYHTTFKKIRQFTAIFQKFMLTLQINSEQQEKQHKDKLPYTGDKTQEK